MPGPGDYGTAASDPYLDSGTGILRNRPGLETAEQLDAFEETVFQAHFPEATAYAKSCASFSLDDWRVVHGICFADVYDWVGEIRTVRIHKLTTTFAYPEHIESEADRLFQALNYVLAQGVLSLEKCAGYYGELNVLHPFREGNGRTQRIIFAAILKRIGYRADYTGLGAEQLIAALIDSYRGDNEKIVGLFRKINVKTA